MRNVYKISYFLLPHMKIKVSISMDKETVQRVEARVKDGIFRNKSHFIELATRRMLEK